MVSLASTNRTVDVVAPSVGGGGGSLKRKNLDHSSDTENATPSQLKRRRVAFNPEVDVRIMSDHDDKSLELVNEEVRRAIEKHVAGEKAAYDMLKGLFKEDPKNHAVAPTTRMLQKYLIAVSNHVHLLDYSCKGLVHAIIDCAWVARNDSFVRSYRAFLHSLLSIQSGFMSTVLQSLVHMFLEAPSIKAQQKDDPPIERVRVEARIHECLRSILRHNSMASTILSPALSGKFPYPDDDAKTHVRYIRNILKVAEYCPELKGSIFSLVTDKLVKIDVQIQVDMEELEDDIEERLVGDAINEAEDDSDNESVMSDDSLDPEEQRLKDIRQAVSKLDTIMDLLFTHYNAIFVENRFEADDLFESLLAQFATTILPTYRSRHTQFLLFHFSQTSADRTEQFAGLCSQVAFDQNRPHILRVAAAAYLGSFIARGAHVSSATVRAVFDLLCHHLEVQRATHEPSCKGPDLRRYGTYYAISQALLYLFCFRWRDLIVTSDGEPPSDQDIVYHDGDFKWYSSTQEIIRRNIFSKLNPLKICAPTIVAQFARMAHHLRFLYVYPLIETNKRVRLARSLASGYLAGVGGRETALNAKKGEGSFLLDAYFPFDPYVLPRSKRWLEEDYVSWKPVPGMPIEKDEDDSDEEEEDEDEDEESSSDSDAEAEEVDEVGELDDDGSTETSL